MRILGLDIGDRRIGVAMSPESPKLAVPYTTVEYSDEDEGLRQLVDLFRKEGVKDVVYGLPVAPDGGSGEQAKKVEAFIVRLSKMTSVNLIPRNERFTTHAAKQSMVGVVRKKKNKKKLVDRLAAVIILQGYLDSIP